MSALSSYATTIVEIDIAKIDVKTEQVHMESISCQLDQGEEFIGLAVVTVTAKKQKKIKSVNMCK